jgi:hypothetical protein
MHVDEKCCVPALLSSGALHFPFTLATFSSSPPIFLNSNVVRLFQQKANKLKLKLERIFEPALANPLAATDFWAGIYIWWWCSGV